MKPPKTITVDGVTYAPVQQLSDNIVIVRSRDSGVHFGELAKRDGTEVTLANARRVWYWKGAASLSQMAIEGVTAPGECKVAVPVRTILVFGVCEVIPCTVAAAENLYAIPEWRNA